MKKINVLIPMAGSGSRFKKEGVNTPKPLIKVRRKTMIETSIDTLGIKNARYFFVKLDFYNNNWNKNLNIILNKYAKKQNIKTIKKVLNGPVESCMTLKGELKKFIHDPLIITNCDQSLAWDAKNFLNFIKKNDPDGVVVTYNSKNKKNSFAKNKKYTNKVLVIKEKKVISNLALVGIHFWKKTSDFIESANRYLKDQKSKQKESFISETYNYLIKEKKNILSYKISNNKFDLIGTPKDLKKFLNKDV